LQHNITRSNTTHSRHTHTEQSFFVTDMGACGSSNEKPQPNNNNNNNNNKNNNKCSKFPNNNNNSPNHKPWRVRPIKQPQPPTLTPFFCYLQTARTGDVVLFRTRGFQGSVTRTLTWAENDHVAMVIRSGPAPCSVMLLEAIAGRGVSTTCLLEFQIHRWYTQYNGCLVRRIEPPLSEAHTNKLNRFAMATKGKKYSLLNVMKSPRSDTCHANNLDDQDIKVQPTYFCSELVAHGLQHARLLPPSPKASKYMPGNFERRYNLQLLAGYTFGKEELIDWDDGITTSTHRIRRTGCQQ